MRFTLTAFTALTIAAPALPVSAAAQSKVSPAAQAFARLKDLAGQRGFISINSSVNCNLLSGPFLKMQNR
jgi:hypothetical protein